MNIESLKLIVSLVRFNSQQLAIGSTTESLDFNALIKQFQKDNMNPSVNDDKSSFMDNIKAYAEKTSAELNIPLKGLLAQIALETNFGKSMPKDSNNVFGIKSTNKQSVTEKTEEYINGQFVKTHASFAKYENLSHAFDGYRSLLKNKRYSSVLNTESVSDFATAIQRSGYATDPDYAKKIINIANKINIKT